MQASFSLEAIDDHLVAKYHAEPRSWPQWKDKPQSPWVARLGGISQRFGYDRLFLDGKKDFQKASRNGSRGVWLFWTLECGAYEVQEMRVRKKPIRYFIISEGGDVRRAEEKEVRQCLLENAVWELVSLMRQKNELNGPLTLSLKSAVAFLAERIHPSCSTSLPMKPENVEENSACYSST